MSTEKDTEIRSRYEDYSVEELQKAFNAIFDSTEEFSDSDVEQMDEIMAVLNRKNPLPQRYTAEEALEHFLEDYSEELSRLGVLHTEEVMEEEPEKAAKVDAAVVVPITHAEKAHAVPASTEPRHGKRGQTLIRTALIAAAVVAVMVIVTISAAAAGINIWGWVPVWNDSTFRYTPEESIASTSIDIPTALKTLEVEEPLFPTWLPEGFLLSEQQIQLGPPIFLHATYVFKDRIILITIRSIESSLASGVMEKSTEDPIVYRKNGIDHDLFQNNEQLVATWSTEKLFIKIAGDISTDELVRIIDSVYEEIK